MDLGIKKNRSTIKKNILSEKYIIIEKIGSGSFGEVFVAEERLNKKKIAAKVESNKKSSRIENEYKIYKYLENKGFEKGLPKVYNLYKTENYNIMFMQLLGPSLDDKFTENKKKFKISTVLLLAIELISLLEKLHKSNYIHRDIKANNFLIGMTDPEQIYIMDFGLSKKYMNWGRHIDLKVDRSLIGTARYASINMHMGLEPSRRDELESIGYMLIYFIKGILPWQGIKKVNGKSHIKMIGEMKMSISVEKLCENLPECFCKYLKYCKNLKFDEEPDYEYMKNIFLETAERYKIKLIYEWIAQ